MTTPVPGPRTFNKAKKTKRSIQLTFALLALIAAPRAHAAEPTNDESASSSGNRSADEVVENVKNAHPIAEDKPADVADKEAARPNPEGKATEPLNKESARPKPEDKPGFGGNLGLGAMYAIARTNMVSSAGFGLVTIGQASLNSLNAEPTKMNVVLPIVTVTLRYNFASTGTQIFFGLWNHGDALQFDSFNQAGVGQKIGPAGKLTLAYLFGLPTRVWSDPYVTGAERHETNRNQQGGRLNWEGIFGSLGAARYTPLPQLRPGVSISRYSPMSVLKTPP